MELRKLGQTELTITPIGLGCWPIAGMTSLEVNDRDSIATIQKSVDCGVKLIDTAYCYGADGESERLVGQAMQGRRDSVVIASKGGIHWEKRANGELEKIYSAEPIRIIAQCEESLQRMKIETIDLHYLHVPDPNTPIEDSASAFLQLLKSGKIRSVGVSNCSVNQLKEFLSICPVAAIQPSYNMLQREIENDLIPFCREQQISVIPYWPLMKGLLAGKIRRNHEFDPDDKRLTYEVFQGEQFEQAQQLLDRLDGIAEEVGKTVAQVVVNWTMHQPGITSVLCGAKRDWQIEETAGAMGWELEPDQMHAINELL